MSVTVVIVARERFSFAERSLASVLLHTPVSVPIVIVDGNSPVEVLRSLENQLHSQSRRNVKIIAAGQYLSPNVARNLGAQQVSTRYVAFVDNDVLVEPHWLGKLVRCADQTSAWAVGPLYCQGGPAGSVVHMAGGKADFYVEDGRRRFREDHSHFGQPVAKIRQTLRCGAVELLEFHTLLLRMDIFSRFGKLDEGYLSVHEHVDLCLTLRQAGLGVVMEPDCVTTYVGPLPLRAYDKEYFALRWCEVWNRLSLQRFQEKWDVDPHDPGFSKLLIWAARHRSLAHGYWQSFLRPMGRNRAQQFICALDSMVSRRRHRADACAPGELWSGGRQIAEPTRAH